MNTPAIHAMTIGELAAWVAANNNGLFDTGEFPAIDERDDDEEAAAREEYEAMAEEIPMAEEIAMAAALPNCAV